MNMTPQNVTEGSISVAAVVWVTEQHERWVECVSSLLKQPEVSTVVLGLLVGAKAAAQVFKHPKVRALSADSASALITSIVAEGYEQILLVTAPLVFPADALANASRWMADDGRIATVSFLSNSAGYLSFPHRNVETPYGVEGHNETSLTRTLRRQAPHPGPTPIAVPEGGAVLLGRSALLAVGKLSPDFDDDVQLLVTEFALRASRRGFNTFLDASTYLTWPWDVVGKAPTSLQNPEKCHRLYLRHNWFPGLHDFQRDSGTEPLAQALDVARAKVRGLRVLIDASCLGPIEMGTQVQTLALIRALSAHDAIQMVGVAMPANHTPSYARETLGLPKVEIFESDGLRFPTAPHVDIIHRPFQPDHSEIPWDRWRGLSKRIVITLQDLIAFRNGSYHWRWEEWHGYRTNIGIAAKHSDALIAISHDVRDAIAQEQLPISPDRLYVAENGIDHQTVDAPRSVPTPIVERGWTDAPLLLVLGANYAHKNRDFAVKVWQILKAKGYRHKLVLAGASVARGSTRIDEAMAVGLDESGVLTLADVTSYERNWLMANASLVLYPTSAEGFGFVPFEAAQFGVPCVYVSFGPLQELIANEDDPVTIWDPEALAARAMRLLDDPEARRKAIRSVLSGNGGLTWTTTAEKVVQAYLQTLGRRSRAG